MRTIISIKVQLVKLTLTIIFLANTFHINAKGLTSDKILGFVENKGQFRDQHGNPNPDVLYIADFGGMKVLLRKDGFSYETYQVKPKWVDPATIPYKVLTITDKGDTLESWPGMEEANKKLLYHYHRVDVKALEANPDVDVIPENSTREVKTYLFPQKNGQRAEVASYSQIRMNGIYPGIDVVYYADNNGKGFKYDFVVHQNGAYADLVLEYQGAEKIAINGNDLEVSTCFGLLKESIPLCYLEDGLGNRTQVDGIGYNLNENHLRFNGYYHIGNQDKLVIDPAVNIVWGTFYGGTNNDFGTGVKFDSLGNIFMCGNTSSQSNIASVGSYQDSLAVGFDGFLVKFSGTGERIWATYLNSFPANDMDISNNNSLAMTGDSGIILISQNGEYLWSLLQDCIQAGIAIDDNNNIIAVGDSLMKLSGSGSIIWKAGNWNNDSTTIKDVVTDGFNSIYVVGKTTQSIGISTPGSHQETYNGSCGTGGMYLYSDIGIKSDGLILKYNPEGLISWGSYYGGTHYDEITSIDCNDSILAIAGFTNSLNYIATQNSNQNHLTEQEPFGRFLFCVGDNCCGQIIGEACNVPLIGCTTYSIGSYDSLWQAMDGFIASFTLNGTRNWGSYTGEYKDDYCSSVKVRNSEVYVGGTSMGVYGLIPTKYSYQSNIPIGSDPFYYMNYPALFIEKYNTFRQKCWSSYYGIDTLSNPLSSIQFTQNINDIDLSNSNNLLIVGSTTHYNSLGVGNCFNCFNQGGNDAFIAKFAEANFDSLYVKSNINPCIGEDTLVYIVMITDDTIGYTYQWYKNSTELTSENDTDLLFNPVKESDDGVYFCKVSLNEFSMLSDSIIVKTRYNGAFNKETVGFSLSSAADINNNKTFDLLGDRIRMDYYLDSQFEEIPISGFNVTCFPIDKNGDEFIDVILSFQDSINSTYKTIILVNNNGFFIISDTLDISTSLGLSQVFSCDLDNDGDKDLILDYSGYYYYNGCSYGGYQAIYRNNNNSFAFVLSPSNNWPQWPIDNNSIGNIFDIDNDGDIDFSKGEKIFINHGEFSFSFVLLPVQNNCNPNNIYSQILDLFSDGVIDVVVSSDGNNYQCGISSPLDFYQFSNGAVDFINKIDSAAGSNFTGDFTNTGYTDIITNGGLVYTGTGTTHYVNTTPELWKYSQNFFLKQPTSNASFVSGITDQIYFFADYDGDGDLDAFSDSILFVNSPCNPPNTPPTAPTGLMTSINNDTVTFSWQRATDLETPQLGLTYNLRVGTTPGGNDIMSSLSDSTGWRKVVGIGNVYQNTGWWLHGLNIGAYYWSVQAIDNSFAGGPFAADQKFVICEDAPPAAEAISGLQHVCQGQKNVLYSIPEINMASSYEWTLPEHATGQSNTNKILVSFSDSATSGNITVKGINSCGEGILAACPVSVRLKPQAPVIALNNSNYLYSNIPTGNQWFNQDGIINGATDQEYIVSSSGIYYAIVYADGCPSDSSNNIKITISDLEEKKQDKTFNIYPNPVADEMILELNENNQTIDFDILNAKGQVVLQGSVLQKISIPTTNFPPGVYLIKIYTHKYPVARKFNKL